MGKKNRKKDTFNKETTCPHVKTGTKLKQIKRLKRSDLKTCSQCEKAASSSSSSSSVPENQNEDGEEAAVCLCLLCGNTGCARSSAFQHAIEHHQNLERHCLTLNLSTWQIWCYSCDNEVSQDAFIDCIRYLKKELGMHKEVAAVVHDTGDRAKQMAVPSFASIKGLTNLGNTCFFNAVMQSLLQTPLLRHATSEESLQCPRLLTSAEGPSIEVTPIPSIDSASLAVSLNSLYSAFHSPGHGTVSPKRLFSAICQKARRFHGYQQQDSQELLRYLLDALKVEEIKRLRAGLVSRAGGMKSEVEERIKRCGISTSTFVDDIFGGKLLSTVVCQECGTMSRVTESFLDLSLPICDDRLHIRQRVSQRGERNDDSISSPSNTDMPQKGNGAKKLSKHQKKKIAQENRKKSRRARSYSLPNLRTNADKDNKGCESAAESDNDEDENEEENHPPEDLKEAVVAMKNMNISEKEESEEPTEKMPGTMEELVFSLRVPGGDSGDGASADVQSVDESSEEAAGLATLAPPYVPKPGLVSLEASLARFCTEEVLDGENKFGCENCTKKGGHPTSESPAVDYGSTEDGDEGEACKRPEKEKESSKSKMIYTVATKRLLLRKLPPVLTFHLKRFHQSNYSLRKINQKVPFPFDLDVAPFCSREAKSEMDNESRVKYSLYGVVEHSGSLRSGHYTAYVKVRANPSQLRFASRGGVMPSSDAPSADQWFYVSDTCVRQAKEESVTSCQAFLLFYERV